MRLGLTFIWLSNSYYWSFYRGSMAYNSHKVSFILLFCFSTKGHTPLLSCNFYCKLYIFTYISLSFYKY